MVLIIFVVFTGAILYALMKKHDVIEESEEDHIDLSRDFAQQLDLVESQYTLGKISKKTRDELVSVINGNAMKLAEEHLSALEEYTGVR